MGVRGLRNSISLSLVVHALFLLVCAILLSQRAAQIHPPKLAWIELRLPKPKTQEAEEEKHRQIVQSDPGHRVEKAAPDAFLGARNQVVDHQTVSKRHEIAMAQPMEQARPATKNGKSAKEMTEKRNQVTPQAAPLSKLGIPVLPHLKELNEANGKDEPQWATNQGQLAEDYIKGMKESERTALNTREFVFYGYYQRIRQRLDRAWVPILRQKLLRFYRGGRSLASDMDHRTRVMVVLNRGGEIVRVQITSESGNAELDDAAIGAFNEAGPFPNPPHGIIDAQGEIQVPWEFILRS